MTSAICPIPSALCPLPFAMASAIPGPRGSKQLPRYITAEPRRYTVRIRRGPRVLRAQVPRSHPEALAQALRLRDQLASQAGRPLFPEHRASPTRARSNTGLVGICETIKWVHYRPRYCFHVALSRPGLPTCKRIYYGQKRTRAQALKIAIKLRTLATQRSQPISSAIGNGLSAIAPMEL